MATSAVLADPAADAVDSGAIDPGQQDQQQTDAGHGDGGQSQQGGQTETPQLDGRRGPANIRGAIKAATEALPEQAQHLKVLGDAYFREQAYKTHFPTPQEAATAKHLIEGIGGVDGANQLQQRIQAYDALDAGLKAGDPAVLDTLFKDSPEAMAALLPHVMERVGRMDPTEFSKAIAPHALGLLESSGLAGHLEAMAAETDPKRAQAMAQQAAEWFKGQKSNVVQLRAQPAKDPRADKLTEQQKQIETEREQIFVERVQEKVNAQVTPEISKTVDQFARQHKWTPEQKEEFQVRLQNEIVTQMQKDQTYLGQVKLRSQNKGRTHDSVAGYMAAEFTRRMNDANGAMAVAAKFNKLIGKSAAAQNGNGVVRAGTPQTAPGGGPLKVSAEPAHNLIDWSKPQAEINFIKNRAYLKDGRFVSW